MQLSRCKNRAYMLKLTAFCLMVCLCTASAGCTDNNSTSQKNTSYGDAVISYLGPEGTYTQEACEKFFGQQGDLIPYGTVADAVAALTDGKSDYAVIPQENTIGGAVVDYIDTLIAADGISVTGEVELPINQNILVLKGTELSDIKTVYSHKQGITQSRSWLEDNLPDAEVIEVSSTAEGARMVAEAGDRSCAAIASAGCADVYNLEILASAIQNNDKNVTRFYVLTKDAPDTEARDRCAFIVSGRASELTKLLGMLGKNGIELVTIHDRPLKTELGEYCYIIECSGTDLKTLQTIVDGTSFEFRFLGNFDM
ncbi:prephenate dehydratase [Ruminococcaceae bacterium YRB3002]|nr:prephenate dehydratase [Ruminococcaceae bacterium YRB3002]